MGQYYYKKDMSQLDDEEWVYAMRVLRQLRLKESIQGIGQ